MKEIKLQVSVEEANLILEALGNLPFIKVYGLIGKLQEQASQQVNGTGPTPAEEGESESSSPTIS